MIALLLVGVLAAQTPPGDAPPPAFETAPAETAPAETAPPVVELAPPVVELAPVIPPPTTTSVPPAIQRQPLPRDDGPAGWDTVPSASAQLGAGTAACCVSCCVAVPLGFIPFVGATLGNIASGVIIGGAEAVVGDAVSQKRAPMLWPMLASSGILVTAGFVNIGLNSALGLGEVDPAVIAADPDAAAAYLGKAAIPLAVGVGASIAAIVVPVVIYHLTGVDKQPGEDGGLSLPGFLEPADPTGTRGSAKAKPTPVEPPPEPAPAPEIIQAY